MEILRTSRIDRFHFFFGHRFGYLAWRLGISANTFTISRLFFVLVGFVLLTLPGESNRVYRLLGVFLLFFQKSMDYGDGTLARVTRTSSQVGRQLDVLVDFGSKLMVFPLIALCSGYYFLIPITGIISYTYYRSDQWIVFGRLYMDETTRNPYFVEYDESDRFPKINRFQRLSVTYPILLYSIPGFIALFNSPDDYSWFEPICLILFIIYAINISIIFAVALVPSKKRDEADKDVQPSKLPVPAGSDDSEMTKDEV